MAARLKLNSPKLPFIWNVSAKVGPGRENPNNPTDVELMKVLLVIALQLPSVTSFGIKGNSIQPPRDSNFDPVLGFWIYRFQQIGHHPAGDGVASPARGITFAPGNPWVIVTFNDFARQADPDLWEGLPRNNSISAQLRAELSG